MSTFKHTGPASGRLWMALWDNYTDAEKQQIVEDFQHELAEKIRGAAPDGVGWGQPMREAADIIDPEVETDG